MSGGEHLTSRVDVAYPFADDAPGVVFSDVGVYGTDARLPAAAVADALAIVPAHVEEVFLWRVTYTDAATRGLQWVDSNGSVLLEASCAVEQPSSAAYFTLAWQNTLTRTTIKMVVCPAWFEFLQGVIDGVPSVFGYSLPLAAYAVQPETAAVLSLDGLDEAPELPLSAGVVTGDATLQAGTNISLDVGASDDGESTPITIAAIPGAGAGRTPCHTPGEVAIPFNGLRPDASGNVDLVGDGCYDVVPYKETGTLVIHGLCKACCSCQRYADIAAALEALFNRLAAAYAALAAARTALATAITAWNAYITGAVTRLVSGELRGSVHGTSYKTLKPIFRRCIVNAELINMSYVGVEVIVSLNLPAHALTRVDLMVYRAYDKAIDGKLTTELTREAGVISINAPPDYAVTLLMPPRSKQNLLFLFEVVTVIPPDTYPVCTATIRTSDPDKGGLIYETTAIPWVAW